MRVLVFHPVIYVEVDEVGLYRRRCECWDTSRCVEMMSEIESDEALVMGYWSIYLCKNIFVA